MMHDVHKLNMMHGMDMGHALSDDDLDAIVGGAGAIVEPPKYRQGDMVTVRDTSVAAGQWSGKVYSMPRRKPYRAGTSWFYEIYVKMMPSPYANVPTIVEDVPENAIISRT